MAARIAPPDDVFPLAAFQRSGRPVVVALRRSHSMRDVRDALAVLAQHLGSASAGTEGICVVVDSRITSARLDEELGRFRAMLRPELAGALYLVSASDGQVVGALPDRPPNLSEAILEAARSGVPLTEGKVSRQYVKARLAERWCEGLGSEHIAEMRRQTGASYQTVAAALAELTTLGAMYEGRDGLPALRGFTAEMLIKLAEEHGRSRKTVGYVDPTQLARPPYAMAKRLLDRIDIARTGAIAIGGVIGASHHYPDLDITGAPRLDLCVFCGSTDFVSKIDAGLLNQDKSTVRADAVLVLHMHRDLRCSTSADGDVASRIDCLADLLEMGFQREASEFAQHLARSARSTS